MPHSASCRASLPPKERCKPQQAQGLRAAARVARAGRANQLRARNRVQADLARARRSREPSVRARLAHPRRAAANPPSNAQLRNAQLRNAQRRNGRRRSAQPRQRRRAAIRSAEVARARVVLGRARRRAAEGRAAAVRPTVIRAARVKSLLSVRRRVREIFRKEFRPLDDLRTAISLAARTVPRVRLALREFPPRRSALHP